MGGSAARGEITLATLLPIGFGLHDATEGFEIVAPLAAESERRVRRRAAGVTTLWVPNTRLGALTWGFACRPERWGQGR